ncbi:MAG: Ig-like domain-containing protein, partial [Bacteroidales bacterium]
QTKQLTAIVKPDDASDKTVSWSSSNEKIASVDATGKVTAVKAGSATITVVTNGTNASGKTELATCDITVTQPVSGVSLDKTSLTIVEGDTATLTATVSPDDASDKTISWSTSDSAIATVENGKVTAVKEGSAKITVTTKDGGKTAECAITVNKKIIPVEGVTIDNTTASLIMGQTLQLTATVTPDDATDKTVSWSSSNASVAGVDADGLVSAKTAGSATITVTTTDGGKMATCDVTVKEMNIDIPDANFKAYLVQNFDKNGDGEISLSEAAAVTDINCNNMSIASLEGIQYFTALTVLECSYNQLTSLDVSKNTALTELHCVSNQLKSLDLSKNTALTVLECSFNQLTSLDVNKNTALTVLHCFRNKLTVLDVSNNTALAVLQCHINKLTVLDMSNNTALQSAFVGRQTDASGNLQWILVKRGSLADSVFPTLGDTGGFNYM